MSEPIKSEGAQPNRVSAAQYREAEAVSPAKHEWLDGETVAMAEGSPNHTHVCANLNRFLENRLSGTPCQARNNRQLVKVEATGLITYADAVIFCPPARFEGTDDEILLSPNVIFEVISPASEKYDRTDKFAAYARIGTLTDYVLIETERMGVEHFQRVKEGWLLRFWGRRGDVLRLPDLEIEMPLDAIYAELELPNRAAPQILPRRQGD